MDNTSQKLLLFVSGFILIRKIYEDLHVLFYGIPQFFYFLITAIKYPFFLYFSHLIITSLTIFSSIIVPIYIIKYFLYKKRLIIEHDFIGYILKPHLLSIVINICKDILEILLWMIISRLY